jgi:hypothetical protein
MPAKLVSIMLNERVALPGLRLNSLTVDVEKQLHRPGWRVAARGPRVFIQSPSLIWYEVSRSAVHLGWEGLSDDDLESGTNKWTSPPREVIKKAAHDAQLAKEQAAPKPVEDDDPNDPDAPIETSRGQGKVRR